MKAPKILISTIAALMLAGGSASAQGPDQVRFDVEAVGEAGVGAIAFLSDADGSTVVEAQLSALPAVNPSGAIHLGTCTVVEDAVELLGFASDAGIVERVVRGAFSALTDGGHVLVLHEGGIDSPVIACGAIPYVEPPSVAQPSVAPQPTAVAQPTSQPQPTDAGQPTDVQPTDPSCPAILAWTSAATERLDRFDELGKRANDASELGDIDTYIDTVNRNLGELGVIMQDMFAEPVPEAAVDINTRLLENLDAIGLAALDQIDAIVSVDQARLLDVIERGRELDRAYQGLRGEITALERRCQ